MAHVEKYERTLFTFEVNVEKLHGNPGILQKME
jgi:hypothetical protein